MGGRDELNRGRRKRPRRRDVPTTCQFHSMFIYGERGIKTSEEERMNRRGHGRGGKGEKEEGRSAAPLLPSFPSLSLGSLRTEHLAIGVACPP